MKTLKRIVAIACCLVAGCTNEVPTVEHKPEQVEQTILSEDVPAVEPDQTEEPFVIGEVPPAQCSECNCKLERDVPVSLSVGECSSVDFPNVNVSMTGSWCSGCERLEWITFCGLEF